jgi:hypothetical protein
MSSDGAERSAARMVCERARTGVCDAERRSTRPACCEQDY